MLSEELERLSGASERLPAILSGWMLAALESGEFTIGSGEYETELAMCPVAAAVTLAEAHGCPGPDWDPAWGTPADFRARVMDFVDSFDSAAVCDGLEMAVGCIVDALRPTRARVLARTDLMS